MASEIWSASLSGWPSLTLSDVKRRTGGMLAFYQPRPFAVKVLYNDFERGDGMSNSTAILVMGAGLFGLVILARMSVDIKHLSNPPVKIQSLSPES